MDRFCCSLTGCEPPSVICAVKTAWTLALARSYGDLGQLQKGNVGLEDGSAYHYYVRVVVPILPTEFRTDLRGIGW